MHVIFDAVLDDPEFDPIVSVRDVATDGNKVTHRQSERNDIEHVRTVTKHRKRPASALNHAEILKDQRAPNQSRCDACAGDQDEEMRVVQRKHMKDIMATSDKRTNEIQHFAGMLNAGC